MPGLQGSQMHPHFQYLFYFVRAVLDPKLSLETITETKDCLLSFALVLNFVPHAAIFLFNPV